MEWTKGKKVMAVIGGIAILFMIYGIVHFIIMNNQYNKVIEVIKQGDYTRAEEMLIDMNVIGTKNDEKMADFRFRSVVSCEHLEIENAEHYFADSAVLYVYISAMEYYTDNKFEYAKNRINLLPEDYSGDLCEEIKTSKQEINKRYEEYQQEMKKSKEEAKEIACQYLKRVGLLDKKDEYPNKLSGGQKQRVAIARALALNPKLIVADEPTSALDVSVRAQVLNLLADLKKELNLAMVFISHDIQTVRQVSDRIVVMYGGQILETGSTEDIFNHPTVDYTRKLLGVAPSLL